MKAILQKHLPDRQKKDDITLQDAMKVTGFKSMAAARKWLNGIVELKRVDHVILASGKWGSVWRKA